MRLKIEFESSHNHASESSGLFLAITQLFSRRPEIDLNAPNCHPEIKTVDQRFYQIEQRFEQEPQAMLDLLAEYSKYRYEESGSAISSVETKADWIMGLLAGIAGFALLHPIAFSFSKTNTYIWLLGLFATVPGLFLCLRCRLPGNHPVSFDIMESILNAEKIDKHCGEVKRWYPNANELKPNQLMQLRIARSRGLAEQGIKLINVWKSKCIQAASAWLIIAFITVGTSTTVDLISKVTSSTHHPTVDPESKAEVEGAAEKNPSN